MQVFKRIGRGVAILHDHRGLQSEPLLRSPPPANAARAGDHDGVRRDLERTILAGPIHALMHEIEHVEQVRDPDLAHRARGRHSAAGIVRSGAGHDRHSSAGPLHHDFHHSPLLRRRERSRLAGRADGDEKVHSILDLPLHE